MYFPAPERHRVSLFPTRVSLSRVRRLDPASLGIPLRARSYVGGPILAHGLTPEDDLVSGMDQAVEYGVGPGRIGHGLMPVLDGKLACYHGRASLAAVLDHLE